MDRGMAAGAKTSALRQPGSVALLADHREIRLGVTPQTKIVVTGHQHFLMDRTMNLMTSSASLSKGFMLPDKWPSLFLMAFEAGFIDVGQRRS